MSDTIHTQDLTDARALMADFFKEVKQKETTLAGGTKLGVGGQAFEDMLASQIELGNPRHQLVHVTSQSFSQAGMELSPIAKQQLDQSHQFYFMTMGVSLSPAGGVQFKRLTLQLDLGPEGGEEPIIESIFPNSDWRSVLQWGGDMKLGLDTDLSWKLGVDDVGGFLKKAGGKFSGKVENANSLGAFITVPKFQFDVGRNQIVATGPTTATARWRIQSPDLKRSHIITSSLLFKVPKDVNEITLVGRVWVEPSMDWLGNNLGHVFDQLSKFFRNLLNKDDAERRGKELLPIGDAEEWKLELPA